MVLLRKKSSLSGHFTFVQQWESNSKPRTRGQKLYYKTPALFLHYLDDRIYCSPIMLVPNDRCKAQSESHWHWSCLYQSLLRHAVCVSSLVHQSVGLLIVSTCMAHKSKYHLTQDAEISSLACLPFLPLLLMPWFWNCLMSPRCLRRLSSRIQNTSWVL